MKLNLPPFLCVPAWTPIATTTRYPPTGTYDLSTVPYLGGVIGLNPAGETSNGVVTFFWTSDAAGEHIVGPEGIHLTSLVPSLAQLRLMNQGPYLYLTFQPFTGPCPLHANLFGTHVEGKLPEIPGDTILIDEQDCTLAANATHTVYPDDFFAGQVRVYLEAPAGVRATLHGADLTNQWWLIDSTGPGSLTTIAPMGTWLVVVHNATGAAVSYALAVTPLV